jgi:hypothetical protein
MNACPISIAENLFGEIQIGNTQKITYERLIKRKQKLDKLLLRRKRERKRMVMVSNKISLDGRGTR